MNPSKQRYVPSLRIILGVGSLVLTILALFTALALIIYPKELRVEVDSIHQINKHLQESNLLTVNLLTFGRRSVLYGLNRKPEDLEAQMRAESQIRNQIQQLKNNVASDGQLQLVNQIEYNSNRFISLRKQMENSLRPTSPQILQAGSEELETALHDIAKLIETSLSQARQTDTRAAYIDRLTDILGSILIVTFLSGFTAVIVLTKNYLYRPLSQIKNTLTRFSHGERSARIELSGARELQDIGRIYNEMADDLQKHEQRRFEFMGGVVHDLRNPLSALKMASDLLARESTQWPDSKARDTMRLVDRQITRLQRMISDLMDATRIQSGQLKLEFGLHDLRKTISECVELWRNMSAKHEIVMTLPKQPLNLTYDAGRIEQVLNNVLSNAIKYSPGGGKILVSASIDPDGKTNISVSDHGIGVPESEINQIFRPFHRASIAHTEKIPGVGLGLSVSKKIIEAHGGKIFLESTVGFGSTFRIQLPSVTAKAA